MYNDMILKIVEVYMRVINETNKNVSLEIKRDYIALDITSRGQDRRFISNGYSAYISHPSNVTEEDLQEIYDVLMSMLEGGATNV